MITGELKSQVDKIWESFWTGGVSNPLTVIEQFTYLLFIRRLNDQGLIGIFDDGDAHKVISIIKRINENAMVG